MPRQKAFFGQSVIPKGQNQGRAQKTNYRNEQRKKQSATAKNQSKAIAAGKPVRESSEFGRLWYKKSFDQMTKNEQKAYLDIAKFQAAKSMMGGNSKAVREMRAEYKAHGKMTGERGH